MSWWVEMCMWVLADLEVSFQQSLDIFVRSVLSQPCLEVLQLVQKSIQTLAKLETTTTKTQDERRFLILHFQVIDSRGGFVTLRGWTDTHGCSFIWSICSQTFESSDQTSFKSCSSSNATCIKQKVKESHVGIFVDFIIIIYFIFFLQRVIQNALCKYLHSLLTAAEKASISELQSFFGTSALLSFILQTAKVALIDCERLKGLLWTQVTLLKQIGSIKNIN